jgi:hypothetical protein
MGQKLLEIFMSFITSLVAQREPEVKVTVDINPPKEEPKTEEFSDALTDWSNPKSMVSKYFTVKEALWLPSWQVLHIPSEDEKVSILKHAQNMDKIREFLGVSLNVHCWIRPVLNNPASDKHGQDYNVFVKGAKNSCHKTGLATDYDATGLVCDDVRTKLESKLEEFDIRMEKMPGGNWVHNDSGEVPEDGHRFFIP